jgi:molecular chaperone DnaK (HSP70)
MIAAGIELGITNSKIGIYKNGKFYIIPNSMGDTCIPSVVAILDDNEIVGEELIFNKANAKNTITEIKRLIGKNINDIKDLKDIHYDISSRKGKLEIKINRKGNDEFYSLEYIISLIFKKLIKYASEFSGTTIYQAVFAVPASFGENQILSIKEAAKLAGIDVLDIIEEPIAAALAYDFGKIKNIKDSFSPNIEKNKDKRNVLVFDLGGGSLNISILTVENEKIEIKKTLEDNNIGGKDFDNKLIDYCLHDFCQKYQIDKKEILKKLDAVKRLKIQCEKKKKKV